MKKTRVFLGNAPWSKRDYYGVRAGSRWPHFESEDMTYMPFPFFLAYATAVLENAGLISTSVRAQERPRRLETAPLRKATEWIERYRRMWETRYLALDGLLEELKGIQTKGEQEK